MNKKKTNIIIVGAIVTCIVVVLGVIAVFGFKSTNAASEHLKANLNFHFRGDVTEMAKIAPDETEENLLVQYEQFIRKFVKANILSGTEVDQETEDKYVEQCKKLFSLMKYEVGKSKEKGENRFEVTVTYEPADFYMKFIPKANEETKRIQEKYDKSEYRGTETDINSEMKKEFLTNALQLFETTCSEMEYGDAQKMTFVITKTKTGVYRINSEEIANFTIKILRLDEIQD